VRSPADLRAERRTRGRRPHGDPGPRIVRPAHLVFEERLHASLTDQIRTVGVVGSGRWAMRIAQVFARLASSAGCGRLEPRSKGPREHREELAKFVRRGISAADGRDARPPATSIDIEPSRCRLRVEAIYENARPSGALRVAGRTGAPTSSRVENTIVDLLTLLGRHAAARQGAGMHFMNPVR